MGFFTFYTLDTCLAVRIHIFSGIIDGHLGAGFTFASVTTLLGGFSWFDVPLSCVCVKKITGGEKER